MLTVEESKARKAAYMRVYRQTHRDHIRSLPSSSTAARRAYKKRYYEANKEHIAAIQRAYRAANREIIKERRKSWECCKPERRRIHILKSAYGLTKEQYNTLVEACKNRCPVCHRSFTEVKACVDHCHETGIVRGLLCKSCNAAEGALKSPERVLRLYEYMVKNELFYQGKN